MPIDDVQPQGAVFGSMTAQGSANYEELAPAWHDGQKHNPATRHRRRLILQLIKDLPFESLLEIGCGQPYLPQEISRQKKIIYTGTDISASLVEQNRKEFPHFHFEVLDIVKEAPSQKYDLIIAAEVIEHVSDYQKALQHIARMAKKYVLVTVPSSRVFPIDRMIGHYRHYFPEDITNILEQYGFRTVVCYRWGFPFHTLYKYLINTIASPEKMRATFAESEYTGIKKFISALLYWLFFLNIKRGGFQLIVLAERKNE